MKKLNSTPSVDTTIDVDRLIRVWDEISDASYHKFSKKIWALVRDSPGKIYIELCSPGGDTYAALAYASLIRNIPNDVVVTATGLVASAAVMILAYGDERRMTEEAWVMVHEDSSTHDGPTRLREVEITHARRLEDQWSSLMAENTSTTKKEWDKMHKETTYLSAQQCLDLGLVDVIV